AGARRGRILPQAMGRGPAAAGRRRPAACEEAHLSWNRYARAGAGLNRQPSGAIHRPRQADGLPVLGRQLARHSSWDDGRVTHGSSRVSPAEARPPCAPAAEARSHLPRSATVRTRAILPRSRHAGLVERGRAGDRLAGFQRSLRLRIPEAPPPRADQSSAPAAERISRRRQLDGGRNPLARSHRTIDAQRGSDGGAADRVSPRHAIRVARGAAHHWQRQCRPAGLVAHPLQMEIRRRLPARRHSARACHHRRPHDRVVRKLPASARRI
ncbi:MAG: Formamidopyrimidine-DNA glycosylase, partial [uncultured Chthoniobacterales bacterium]